MLYRKKQVIRNQTINIYAHDSTSLKRHLSTRLAGKDNRNTQIMTSLVLIFPLRYKQNEVKTTKKVSNHMSITGTISFALQLARLEGSVYLTVSTNSQPQSCLFSSFMSLVIWSLCPVPDSYLFVFYNSLHNQNSMPFTITPLHCLQCVCLWVP